MMMWKQLADRLRKGMHEGGRSSTPVHGEKPIGKETVEPLVGHPSTGETMATPTPMGKRNP